ncbi:uncharacterized protein BX663DRAFT_503761 [Cokeromyces recurvatus]|uniref:uncharacterized protein n=1 Tax=Cokeromyces recurvatus TaxID=90255 RepID=UPI00221EDA35|nr:uncharacterized protein BX663DRAFT_503761 [Cokeromyces recurvatus]KAI7904842.1 hypothetical protein BX663DRAFT_503761 [Cokeromyces recurvatus]
MKNIILLILLSILGTNAFCIYNNIEKGADGTVTKYWLRQQPYNAGPNYFSRFANYNLANGEKTCCAYTNTDCCRSGKIDDELYMVAARTTGTMTFPPLVISFPSGGSIVFNGDANPATEKIKVYNPDGSPYGFKFRVDDQAGYT